MGVGEGFIELVQGRPHDLELTGRYIYLGK